MVQHSKGVRKQIQPRLPSDVYDAIHTIAKQHGTSVSQYVADLCSIHVGRPDLVWIPPNQDRQQAVLFPDECRKVS